MDVSFSFMALVPFLPSNISHLSLEVFLLFGFLIRSSIQQRSFLNISMNEEKNKCCYLNTQSFPKDVGALTLFACGGSNNRLIEYLFNDFSFETGVLVFT